MLIFDKISHSQGHNLHQPMLEKEHYLPDCTTKSLFVGEQSQISCKEDHRM